MNENNPKVTVVVCNYNHGKYLRKSIESIKRQTYSNFDIVLVDDGSTDAYTKQVLEELCWEDDSITTILNDTNKGKWAVLNQAIASIDSPLVMIHDADDIALKQKIEAHVKAMQLFGSCHNLTGFYHCYSDEDMEKHWDETFDLSNMEHIVLGHDHTYSACSQSRLNISIGHYVASPDFEVHGGACMFETQKWKEGLRYCPPGLDLRIQRAEDSDLNTKFTLLLQKTSVVKLPLYCYRRNTSTNPAWRDPL